VAAGLGHAVAACKDGDFLSWGWNAGNQLGLGPTDGSQVVALPTKLDIQARAHRLAAGRAHSLVCRRERSPETYAWGSGREGRLGSGSQQGSDRPEFVPGLEGCSVLGMACGMDHSLVLTET
jgi:alpha-tubulin suppressor-like RCC1 family protein